MAMRTIQTGDEVLEGLPTSLDDKIVSLASLQVDVSLYTHELTLFSTTFEGSHSSNNPARTSSDGRDKVIVSKMI
jgi:hypothetical protein